MQNKTLERQTTGPIHAPSHHAPLAGQEIHETVARLEARIKKLGDICNELNPYSPMSNELKKRLREFNIMEFEDPFKITNALLMLLEDSINELHLLQPLSPEELAKENLR
jgi:hypothetical protein